MLDSTTHSNSTTNRRYTDELYDVMLEDTQWKNRSPTKQKPRATSAPRHTTTSAQQQKQKSATIGNHHTTAASRSPGHSRPQLSSSAGPTTLRVPKLVPLPNNLPPPGAQWSGVHVEVPPPSKHRLQFLVTPSPPNVVTVGKTHSRSMSGSYRSGC